MSDITGHNTTTCSGNGNGPIALAVERALLLSAPQPAHAHDSFLAPPAPPESFITVGSFPLQEPLFTSIASHF